jgi:hypothetical protein
MKLIIFAVLIGLSSCARVFSQNSRGSGAGLTSIKVNMPDRSKFADTQILRDKLNGVQLSITPTSNEGKACTPPIRRPLPWLSNDPINLPEAKLNQGCSYTIQVDVGELSSVKELKNIYFSGQSLVGADLIANKSEVNVSVKVRVTQLGQKAGFTNPKEDLNQKIQTIAGLLHHISTGHITSVEDVLSNLNTDHLRRYVIMTKSDSLQAASAESPRIITYGRDARFLLAFNGGGNQEGGQTVEVIEFDDTSETYEFRQIAFSTPGAPPSVSQKNPEECAGCHSSSFRPIWEDYDLWPGAVPDNAYPHELDLNYLQSFVTAAATSSRYKFLLFNENSRQIASGSVPSVEMDQLLEPQFVKWLTSWLRSIPDYPAFKYAIAASLIGCGDIVSYFPAAFGLGGSQKWNELKDDFIADLAKVNPGEARWAMESTKVTVANLRYLFEAKGRRIRDIAYSPSKPYGTDGTAINRYLAVLKTLGQRDQDLLPDIQNLGESAFRYAFRQGMPEKFTEEDRLKAENFCRTMKQKTSKAIANK